MCKHQDFCGDVHQYLPVVAIRFRINSMSVGPVVVVVPYLIPSGVHVLGSQCNTYNLSSVNLFTTFCASSSSDQKLSTQQCHLSTCSIHYMQLAHTSAEVQPEDELIARVLQVHVRSGRVRSGQVGSGRPVCLHASSRVLGHTLLHSLRNIYSSVLVGIPGQAQGSTSAQRLDHRCRKHGGRHNGAVSTGDLLVAD